MSRYPGDVHPSLPSDSQEGLSSPQSPAPFDLVRHAAMKRQTLSGGEVLAFDASQAGSPAQQGYGEIQSRWSSVIPHEGPHQVLLPPSTEVPAM